MGTLNRQLFVSCALTAGLLVAGAPTVFAADPPAHSKAGGSDTGQANSAGGQATAAEAQGNGPNAGGSDTGQANSAQGQANAADNRANAADNRANAADHRANAADNRANAADNRANPGGGNQDGGNQGNHNAGGGNQAGGKAGAARTAPPGNNGTIKVDMDGLGLDRRNNEPQGGCQGVTIKFFNFDPNEVINVSFKGQAPTRFGHSATRTVTAGSNGYTTAHFSFAQIVPAGTSPSKNGGWHVKVEANGVNHPAGVKKKVFWLRCATSGTTPTTIPDTTTTTVADTTTTTVAETTTTTVADTTTTTAAPTTTTTVATTTTAVGGVTEQNETTTTRLAVLGEVIERNRAADVAGTQRAVVAASPAAAGVNAGSAARVLGTTVERGALARTGLNALQLLTMGALSILAGIAAVRASRRKTAEVPRFPI